MMKQIDKLWRMHFNDFFEGLEELLDDIDDIEDADDIEYINDMEFDNNPKRNKKL